MNTRHSVMQYIRNISDPNHKENLKQQRVLSFISEQIQRILNENLDLNLQFTEQRDVSYKPFVALFSSSTDYDDHCDLICRAILETTGVFVATFSFEARKTDPESAPAQDASEQKPRSGLTAMGGSTPRGPAFYTPGSRDATGAFFSYLYELTVTRDNYSPVLLSEVARQAGYRLSFNVQPNEITVVLS